MHSIGVLQCDTKKRGFGRAISQLPARQPNRSIHRTPRSPALHAIRGGFIGTTFAPYAAGH
ncbi:MAG: hypothetical protein JSS25_09045 [Proteobacteria bacterium]|nr:hypothetical protein [Pseudomonadota bacterium]